MSAPSGGRTPAAVAACALAAGTLLGRAASVHAFPFETHCVACCLAVAAATVHTVVKRRAGRAARLSTDALIILALVAAGSCHYRARHDRVLSTDVSLAAPSERAELLVRLSESRTTAGGRRRALGKLMGGDDAPTGDVWISFRRGVRAPEDGETVRVRGALERPTPPRNPGAFDFRSYLSHRGIHAVLSSDAVTTVATARGFTRAANWIREQVATRVAGERGALLTGLLLGDSSLLPGELAAAFRRSGTVHVLAVSGLHVGFVGLMAFALLRSLRAPPMVAKLLIIPCLAAFVMLVGLRPSVVRASIMAGVMITAWAAERRPNPVNTLGLAAVSILLVRPGSLFDAGFGLSFGAAGGIITIFPVLRPRLAALERAGRAGRFLADSLSVSASAQLGVAPVAVAAFGQLSLVAPLANLAAVPLAAFSVASGAAMLAAGPLPRVADIFAGAAWASLSGLSAVATAAGGAVGAARVATRFWPVPGMLALGLAALGPPGSRRRRLRRTVSGVCLSSAVAVGLALSLFGPGRSAPRMIVFDVGQGDSILVELPGGRAILIDAGKAWGGASGGDAATSAVLPYLRRSGIHRLDALVVTHGHLDHYGGAASVMNECRPDALILPRGYEASLALVRTAGAARSLGIPVVETSTGDTLLSCGGNAFTVLSPPPGRGGRPTNENNRSVVVRVKMGPASALLTGDIEREVESALVGAGGEEHERARPCIGNAGRACRTDRRAIENLVLKVPHHGSSSSSTRPFLDAVRARIAIVSVGEGNRYGHPDSAVVDRLRATGAFVLRTDRDGAVLVDVLRDRVVARGFLSGLRREASYEDHQGREGPTTTVE